MNRVVRGDLLERDSSGITTPIDITEIIIKYFVTNYKQNKDRERERERARENVADVLRGFNGTKMFVAGLDF